MAKGLNQTIAVNGLLASAIEARNMLYCAVYNAVDDNNVDDNYAIFEELMVNLQNQPPLITLITGTNDIKVEDTWVGKRAFLDVISRACVSYAIAQTCSTIQSGYEGAISSTSLLSLDDVIELLKDYVPLLYRDVVKGRVDAYLADEGEKRMALILAFEFLLHHCEKEDASGFKVG